jgi:hypothetical protein
MAGMETREETRTHKGGLIPHLNVGDLKLGAAQEETEKPVG